jgi:response regulator RpfG family c-di-GMP phosphodiesterase
MSEVTTVATILCVDDEPNILSALRRLFRPKGYKVLVAESGKAGLELLQNEKVDLVISDMRMPEMDGAQFLAQVRAQWPDSIRILLTGYADVNAIIEAINRGEIYRYITKPWNDNDIDLIVKHALERRLLEQEKARLERLTFEQNEALKSLNTSLEAKVEERTNALKAANEQLKNSFITSIKVFSNLIEMRGGNLAGHSRRVADLARKIAIKLELDGKAVQDAFASGLLCDIGKVGFADELLSKPIALMSPAQLEEYRKHVVRAEQLLMPLQDLRGAAANVGGQLERFDGNGFPSRLSKDATPIGAQILAVAADYDNLQIGTMAQRKVTAEDAKILILQGIGNRYAPRVVEAFEQVLQETAGPKTDPQGITECTSHELQAGMVLAKDLITPTGFLMLSANHVLDERLIQKVLDFERSAGLKLTLHIRAEKAP